MRSRDELLADLKEAIDNYDPENKLLQPGQAAHWISIRMREILPTCRLELIELFREFIDKRRPDPWGRETYLDSRQLTSTASNMLDYVENLRLTELIPDLTALISRMKASANGYDQAMYPDIERRLKRLQDEVS